MAEKSLFNPSTPSLFSYGFSTLKVDLEYLNEKKMQCFSFSTGTKPTGTESQKKIKK